MFSKELEEVIDAAIADGVLTDKERAVLHKRAQAEGVDPDELDVVIEGRLAKKKKEEDWLRPAPPKAAESNKLGNVMKCPNCGAPYQPGTGKCPECGHLFQNAKGNSSMEKLSEGLQRILGKEQGMLDSLSSHMGLGSSRDSQVSQYIANFPIPNTKDDMIEFIVGLDAMRRMSETSRTDTSLKKAYGAKYKEVVNKARVIFAGDKQIENAIIMTDKFSMSLLPYLTKFLLGYLFFLLILGIVLLIVFL